MHEIFTSIEVWYELHLNYGTVFMLMTIESSFIPFPSEIVVPPAAWLAAKGKLNLLLVIFFATLGSLAGALFNYYFAYYLGRPVIYKLAGTKVAKLLLITPESVKKSEDYFNKYGNISTFIGRLVPVVRQLISIPAGLARMKLSPFIIYTTSGALIWNVILAVLGYFLYSQKDILEKYYSEISLVFLGLGVIFAGYIIFKILKKKSKKVNE